MAFEINIFGSNQLIAKWKSIGPRLTSALQMAMQTQMVQLADYVRLNKLSGSPLHRRSGNLSRSINGKSRIQGNQVIGTVGFPSSEVPYGVYWEKTGIRAHTIEPVNAKVLRFMINDNVVFARSVSIPAQAPRPFLRPSLAENRTKITAALRSAATEAFR